MTGGRRRGRAIDPTPGPCAPTRSPGCGWLESGRLPCGQRSDDGAPREHPQGGAMTPGDTLEVRTENRGEQLFGEVAVASPPRVSGQKEHAPRFPPTDWPARS